MQTNALLCPWAVCPGIKAGARWKSASCSTSSGRVKRLCSHTQRPDEKPAVADGKEMLSSFKYEDLSWKAFITPHSVLYITSARHSCVENESRGIERKMSKPRLLSHLHAVGQSLGVGAFVRKLHKLLDAAPQFNTRKLTSAFGWSKHEHHGNLRRSRASRAFRSLIQASEERQNVEFPCGWKLLKCCSFFMSIIRSICMICTVLQMLCCRKANRNMQKEFYFLELFENMFQAGLTLPLNS